MNVSFSTRRFWVRLGNPNALGPRLFLVALAFIAMLSYAFDVVRLGNFTWAWLPANALAVLISLLILLPALVLKRATNSNQAPQPWFNIVASSLFFGIKNLSMLYVSPLFGIAEEGIPAFRFIGGLFLGVALLVLFTNVDGNRLQRTANLSRLQDVENQLLAFREGALEELEDENREVASNTIQALSPQLEDLQVAVKQSKDIVYLANQVISFIRSELRPFSESLTREAQRLSKQVTDRSETRIESELKVDFSKSIKVWNSLVPLPLLMFLTAVFAVPKATAWDIAAMCVAFVATLLVFKVVTVKLPSLTVIESFMAISAVAFFSGLPGFFILYQIPNETGVPELLPSFIVMQGWSVIAATQAHILDLGQSKVENELNEAIAELARENKLYEQKAWLARHGWYLLIHGVVQPALTSAAIRASSSQNITEDVKNQILNDLQRALDSLKESRPVTHTLENSILEIQSVWNGICEIGISLAPELKATLAVNDVANQIVNEILKEVVSNAVRHGNATNIQGTVLMSDYRTIDILISNDGLKPTREKIESVGSKMLDAVCLERALEWNDDLRRTEFRAVVPLKS